MDSTGVAHILEHTTLCGSENFPVRQVPDNQNQIIDDLL